MEPEMEEFAPLMRLSVELPKNRQRTRASLNAGVRVGRGCRQLRVVTPFLNVFSLQLKQLPIVFRLFKHQNSHWLENQNVSRWTLFSASWREQSGGVVIFHLKENVLLGAQDIRDIFLYSQGKNGSCDISHSFSNHCHGNESSKCKRILVI